MQVQQALTRPILASALIICFISHKLMLFLPYLGFCNLEREARTRERITGITKHGSARQSLFHVSGK